MKLDAKLSSQLIENSIEGIWVIDDQHKTLYVNKVLSKLLGYEQQDFIGKEISDFMN